MNLCAKVQNDVKALNISGIPVIFRFIEANRSFYQPTCGKKKIKIFKRFVGKIAKLGVSNFDRSTTSVPNIVIIMRR